MIELAREWGNRSEQRKLLDIADDCAQLEKLCSELGATPATPTAVANIVFGCGPLSQPYGSNESRQRLCDGQQDFRYSPLALTLMAAATAGLLLGVLWFRSRPKRVKTQG